MDRIMYNTKPTLILNSAAGHLRGRNSVAERVTICLRAPDVVTALTQTEHN